MTNLMVDKFPALRSAFLLIQLDNGYINRQTPEPRYEIDGFDESTLQKAEAALSRLSISDLETFCTGEEQEQIAIYERQGDLGEAQEVLSSFFGAL